jgi:hypothetical protein
MNFWIDVKNELPDDDTAVLVATTDGEVMVGYYDDEHWYEDCAHLRLAVTHWQHLPPSPGDGE